jgi:hypothetical protein
MHERDIELPDLADRANRDLVLRLLAENLEAGALG